MIEQGLMSYLLAQPTIKTMTKGQIYYRKAPPTAKMPWVVVTNSGGMRQRLNYKTISEATDTLTLYVECDQQFAGRAIADEIIKYTENFRGDMLPAKDVYVRAGTVRDLDGYNGTFRYLITLYVRYIYTPYDIHGA